MDQTHTATHPGAKLERRKAAAEDLAEVAPSEAARAALLSSFAAEEVEEDK